MKNNKGFTLIEIIVSIALLGIISVGMLSGMTSEFKLLKGTQEVTEDVSSVQQRMELEISEIKKSVQLGVTSENRTLYTLFSGTNQRNIYGYPREFEVSLGNTSRTLFTIIADNRMPDFDVATANINIEFSNGNMLKYAYQNTTSLLVKSTTTIEDPENVNLTNIYRWYVSRKGFYIPMSSSYNPTEIENGTKYPRFPDDYSIIPGVSTTNLTNIATNYTGRHLICTVTPAARSGKMGATAVSKPVLLSGLPVTDGLGVHLDASMISKDDVDSSRRVTTWPDISVNKKDAKQVVNDNRKPIINETYVGDVIDKGIQYQTFVKYLAFDGTNDSLEGNIGSLSSNKTVFVVARDRGAEDFIISKNAYNSLITIENDGGLKIGYNGTNYVNADIAEVIIYKKTLSTSDSNLVNAYLKEKYNPTAPVLTIQYLQPVTATVTKDNEYTLPTIIPAIMSNGQTNNVAVTWSPNTIDTSTIGIKMCNGTAAADSTKSTTLTVTVVAAIDNTPFEINAADVNIAAPLRGATANTTTTVQNATNNPDFTVTNLTWSPNNTIFAANTTYTVAVKLTSKNGKWFGPGFTPTVTGSQSISNIIISNGGNTASFIVNYSATESETINAAGVIITVPVKGATPNIATTVQNNTNNVDFTVTTVTWNPNNTVFAENTVYTATVTLTAKNGKIFALGFKPTVAGSQSISNINVGNGGNTVSFSVNYQKTELGNINAASITIAAPVKGATANIATTVQNATNNPNFTVTTVIWNPNNTTFTGNTAYTATVTLTAKSGKIFISGFTPTVAGSQSISNINVGNGGNTVSFSVNYQKTELETINAASVIITAPVKGATPNTGTTVQNNTKNPDFTVTTVTWSPNNTTFAGNKAYTATVTLTAKNGKIFASGFKPTVAGSKSVSEITIGNGGNTVTFKVNYNKTSK